MPAKVYGLIGYPSMWQIIGFAFINILIGIVIGLFLGRKSKPGNNSGDKRD